MIPEWAATLQQAVGNRAGDVPRAAPRHFADAPAVYGALLPAFPAAGRHPGPDALAAGAGLAHDTVGAALGELAAADVVALGPRRRRRGDVPLSAVPTWHRDQVQHRPFHRPAYPSLRRAVQHRFLVPTEQLRKPYGASRGCAAGC